MVANRTPERAMELAAKLQGQGVALAELPIYLPQADIIVSSTGAAEIIIHRADVQGALKRRKHRSMFFIDIAVPRDIDPAVNELANVYLYDIDDLQHVVEENRLTRAHEAVLAEPIIARAVEDVLHWLDEQQVVPAVIRLRRTAPDLPRPYRAWGYPLTPILFIVFAVWLVGNTIVETPKDSAIGAGLILLGLPGYFYWRRATGSGKRET